MTIALLPRATRVEQAPRWHHDIRTALQRLQAGAFDAQLPPALEILAWPTVVVMFLVTVLSVGETYFVAALGADAIAAAAMLVPVLLLMTMVSNGGIGGGVSSAIARARGAGREADAESLTWHALLLALVFGALFTLALWAGEPALYRFLGGRVASLEQAVPVLFGFGTAAVTVVATNLGAAQGARRIAWPMAETSVRLACAVLATLLAARGDVGLGAAFALVAAGIVCGAALSLWGYAWVTWPAGARA